MKWSWKLGRLAGIDVYVHATFFILIAWIGLNYWQAGHSLASVVAGVAFILTLFLCVVLHELGHALTARRYGIGTRYITLLPIGGIAMLERMPRDPKQEIAVALAGQKALLGHPAVVVHLGEIAVAGIADEHDNALGFCLGLAPAQRGGENCARGTARKNAFLARQLPRHGQAFLIGNQPWVHH